MKKQILSSITNTYLSQDPQYFRLYKSWQQLGQKIKFLAQQNQNIRIENENMNKEHNKLRVVFYNISNSIVKKKPVKIHADQIRTKMRINQLRNRVKGHEFDIKRLGEEQKSFVVENVEESCLEMLLEQIDLSSEIMRYQLLGAIKEDPSLEIPTLKNPELQEFDEDDCHKIQELKNTKRDILTKLKAQLDLVQKQIQKQTRTQTKMKQSKARNTQTHKYYNRLIETRGKQRKRNDNLVEQIKSLNEEICCIKGELEAYNVMNQEIKLKLIIKKEHELRENKNLKEEIEKYTQQCNEVKGKYYSIRDIIKGNKGYH